MQQKYIENISYNILIPESLKTDNFYISVFLDKNKKSNVKNLNYLTIYDYYENTCTFSYSVRLNNIKDLLKCINFFKTFEKRSSNLIQFDSWDDEDGYDLSNNYFTIFYFKILNIKKFYNFYNLSYNLHSLEKDLKNIIINNFLNV